MNEEISLDILNFRDFPTPHTPSTSSGRNYTRFSENFWDEKLNGFGVLSANLDNSKINVRELEIFLREMAASEDQYIKQTNKTMMQVQKFSSDTMLSPIWHNVVREYTEQNSHSHFQFMSRLFELIKEIQTYFNELKKKKRNIRENELRTAQLLDNFRYARQQLSKAKEQYIQLNVELKRQQHFGDASSGIVAQPASTPSIFSMLNPNQLSILQQRLEKKAQASVEEYKQAIDKYNQARVEFEQRYLNACESFQMHEESHLSQMHSFINSYLQLCAQLNDARQKSQQDFTKKLNSIYNVDLLIQQFIINKGTGSERLPVAEFVDVNTHLQSQSIDLAKSTNYLNNMLIEIGEYGGANNSSDSNQNNANNSISPPQNQQPVPENTQQQQQQRKKSTSDRNVFGSIFNLSSKMKLRKELSKDNSSSSHLAVSSSKMDQQQDATKMTESSFLANEPSPVVISTPANTPNTLRGFFDFNKSRVNTKKNRFIKGRLNSLSNDVTTTTTTTTPVASVISRADSIRATPSSVSRLNRNGVLLPSSYNSNNSIVEVVQRRSVGDLYFSSNNNHNSLLTATSLDENNFEARERGEREFNATNSTTTNSRNFTNYNNNLGDVTTHGSMTTSTTNINQNRDFTDEEDSSLRSQYKSNFKRTANNNPNGDLFEEDLFDGFSLDHQQQPKPKPPKDNTDMNNLYESSESNEELNSKMKKLNQDQQKSQQKFDGYEDYDETSSDSSGDGDSSDDSDGPKKILVKIKPIDEIDRTNMTSPDMLNQISKSLKLRIENSEKIQKIKRKTYMRKMVRNSFNKTIESNKMANENDLILNASSIPNILNTSVSSMPADSVATVSLFEYNFNSFEPSNKSGNNYKYTDSNNNEISLFKEDGTPSFPNSNGLTSSVIQDPVAKSEAPPLPPLPADFRIFDKLNAFKNSKKIVYQVNGSSASNNNKSMDDGLLYGSTSISGMKSGSGATKIIKMDKFSSIRNNLDSFSFNSNEEDEEEMTF